MKEIFSGLIVLIVICVFLWNIAPYIVVLIIVGGVVAIGILISKRNQQKHNDKVDDELQPLSSKTGDSLYTKVVGVTFDGIQSILPQLHAGMPLRLIREPGNQYDRNAVAVWCNGKKIGHLSKELASDIAPLMDKGIDVGGTIEQITGGGGKTYGCNIQVTIYK